MSNTLFDYEKAPCLIANFGESLDDAKDRLLTTINQLGARFEKSLDNPRKEVYVLVSHGIHLDAFLTLFTDPFVPASFCSINLAKIVKPLEGASKPDLEVLVYNAYAY